MPMQMMMNPQVILLKDGTDTSQGKAQLLSNITAALAVVDILRTTLGPSGSDKLIVDSKAVISNDGATIMKLLDVVHPAARSLVDIARAQDAEVGDGTTSVVLLAGELLAEARTLVEDGMAPRAIIRGFRMAATLAQQALVDEDSLASLVFPLHNNDRKMLERIASTSMNSKIIRSAQTHFARLVVDYELGREINNESREQPSTNQQPSWHTSSRDAGIKRIPGGSMEDSVLVNGIAFKKTFSYAGHEQQPKRIDDPRVLLLNVELELKAERDNAELRIAGVADYAAIVEGEWTILHQKLERIVEVGATVVLSRLPIGDVATQYFADRGLFSAGRVPMEDLQRLSKALVVPVVSTVAAGEPLEAAVGHCAIFEERQVGAERFNFFSGFANESAISTFLLRGGSDQFIAEVERSLHDALMVVQRALRHRRLSVGGGATEMALSRILREAARAIPSRLQRVVQAYARALEVIPRQLCYNAGIDAVDVLALLRKRHAQPESPTAETTPIPYSGRFYGVNLAASGGDLVANLKEEFVWEPTIVKENMISAATEAATLILSVDETIRAVPPPPMK
ncbi:subunit eta of T-complex protein 1 [Mitosporidium daphniae]|uniref:CCT-eta n=1 Tax=Mitosporidium daphniae TaxID=1485682 RepID=A0A098VP87_9MICR|nr:subunit eta of T-complex protein 1 [Mitosporidium daphniae]KGG50624.1 subunit eta of T-complex protein 1 [Mitosporidium daphniae]|eukprot:XP_013237051.1 subunit eta of T-complex protein 1 [Mitosporidium daphniae]